MRAREFMPAGLQEGRGAKIPYRHRVSTRGLNLFKDGEKWNSDYTLNRVMMAAAFTDGTFVPNIYTSSWVGKGKTAHPYTKQEQAMMKMAYRAAGASYQDLNRGDLDSEELKDTNNKSPVKAFKGYPR